MSDETHTTELAPAALVAAAPSPIRERVRRRVLGASRPAQPAPGLELIGQMKDSGFEDPPYLVRRADGQVVQLPELLYVVLDSLGPRRGYDDVASSVADRFGAQLDPEDARFLVDEKLKPLGLVTKGGRFRRHQRPQAAAAHPPAAGDAEPGDAAKGAENGKPGDDLLALTWKARVVPEGAVRAITTIFRPLFHPVAVVPIVAAFLALMGWFFFSHGVSQPLRAVIYKPSLIVMVFAGVVVATAFHEIGHATAVRYGGANPGVLGIGLYVIWPVFYTDVTDAYRLGRAGRLRTDLGGIYFNSIFALCVAGAYMATHWEPILLLVMVQAFTIVQQLLPLGRLDGYLILTDLTGVPDLLSRMKPILRSMIPGRKADDGVKELKPWVRRVATGYMALLVPILLFMFAMMLFHAPRVFATVHDSLGVRWDNVRAAFGADQYLTGAGNLLQCAALVLPAVGMTATSMRVGKRIGGAAWAWSAGAPVRRIAVVAASTVAAGGAAYTWAPNGDYRPIQPGDRGTVSGGFHSLAGVPSGRPAFTVQQDLESGAAPTERELRKRDREKGIDPGAVGRDRNAARERSDRQGGVNDPSETGRDGTGTMPVPSGSGTGSGTGTTPSATSPTTTSPSSTDTSTTTTPSDTTTTPSDTTTTPSGTTTTPSDTTTTPSDTTTTPSTGSTTGSVLTAPSTDTTATGTTTP